MPLTEEQVLLDVAQDLITRAGQLRQQNGQQQELPIAEERIADELLLQLVQRVNSLEVRMRRIQQALANADQSMGGTRLPEINGVPE